MATIHCNLCGCRLSTGAHALIIMDLVITDLSVMEISENMKSYLCDDCLDEIKEVMEERKIIYHDE